MPRLILPRPDDVLLCCFSRSYSLLVVGHISIRIDFEIVILLKGPHAVIRTVTDPHLHRAHARCYVQIDEPPVPSDCIQVQPAVGFISRWNALVR